MGRYDHIKRKPSSTTVDEFIEGAGKDATAKTAKKIHKNKDVLLSITGRANLEEYEKAGLIYVRKDIQADILKYCHGSKQAIINYLLRRGLDDLIKEGKTVIETHE